MPHTPGPWKCCKQPHPRIEHLTGYAIYGGDGTIADIFPEPYPVHVSEANARLIAAAPELLESLIEAEHAITRQIYHDDLPDDDTHPLAKTRRMLRAAIAKAEGRN